jgi:hypothetical protein
MANASPDGQIRLNSFWFADEPARLQRASDARHTIDAGGVSLGWHGPMTEEPRQVLTHEFFHCLYEAIPSARPWSERMWSRATREPSLAPSGYALSEPGEWFAEFGAMREMGFAPPALVLEWRSFLLDAGGEEYLEMDGDRE